MPSVWVTPHGSEPDPVIVPAPRGIAPIRGRVGAGGRG